MGKFLPVLKAQIRICCYGWLMSNTCFTKVYFIITFQDLLQTTLTNSSISKNIPPEAVAGQNDTDGQNHRDDDGYHSQCHVRRFISTCDRQQTSRVMMGFFFSVSYDSAKCKPKVLV